MDFSPNQNQAAEVIQDGANPATAPQTKPPAAATDETQSFPKLRNLIARERELHEQRRKLQSEADSWKSKESEFQRWQRIQELAKTDPEAAVREMGLSVEQINERRLQSPEERTMAELQAKINALEGKLNERDQKTETEKQQQVLQQARAEIDRVLTSSDDFELCRLYEDHDMIFQTAALFTEKTGKFVSLDEAAKWVEQERESQLERILSSKKARAAWDRTTQKPQDQAGQQAAKEVLAEAKQSSSQGQPKESGQTLTADLTGSAMPSSPASSIAQLRARALETMKAAWPPN